MAAPMASKERDANEDYRAVDDVQFITRDPTPLRRAAAERMTRSGPPADSAVRQMPTSPEKPGSVSWNYHALPARLVGLRFRRSAGFRRCIRARRGPHRLYLTAISPGRHIDFFALGQIVGLSGCDHRIVGIRKIRFAVTLPAGGLVIGRTIASDRREALRL